MISLLMYGFKGIVLAVFLLLSSYVLLFGIRESKFIFDYFFTSALLLVTLLVLGR